MPLSRTARIYQRLNTWLLPWAARSRYHLAAYDFLWFGLKQGWACLFGVISAQSYTKLLL